MLEGGIWMGNRKLRLLFTLIPIALMVMIFLLSAQPGEESAIFSGSITEHIARFLDERFDRYSEQRQAIIVSFLDRVTRKVAHFSEYALLAFFLRLWWETMVRRHASLLAWLCATVYAATDELHQLFVSGRGASIKDVCIDSSGALFGALLGFVLVALLARRRARKERENA